MGYSKNPTAIDKVEKFLTLMVNADESLEWETPSPDRLAYYIREGIFASKAMCRGESESDKLKAFASLKSKFVLKIKVGSVLAELRNEVPFAIMGVKRMKSVYLPNIATLTEIVGAIAKYIIEEEKEQITIPSPNLNEAEFSKLEAYLTAKKLEIKVDGSELVISKRIE